MEILINVYQFCFSELDLDFLEKKHHAGPNSDIGTPRSPIEISPDSVDRIKVVLLGASAVGKSSIIQVSFWTNSIKNQKLCMELKDQYGGCAKYIELIWNYRIHHLVPKTQYSKWFSMNICDATSKNHSEKMTVMFLNWKNIFAYLYQLHWLIFTRNHYLIWNTTVSNIQKSK